jgi:1-acyl-sn-glycerol-3-phosphate acyltransferase
MRKLLQYLNMAWAAVLVPTVFIGIATPLTLIAFPLPLRARLWWVGPFWKLFALSVIRGACWASVHVEDHRQPELRTRPPQGLYISNHQSYLDIPLMLTQYQVLPIMKKEILYIPIFGLVAWVAGAMVVSRGHRGSRKKVFVQARKRLVTDRFSLQYYPEGTRSKDGHPRPLDDIKANLIQVAFDAGVPVVPISMWGTSQVLNQTGIIHPGRRLGIITHRARLPQDYADAESFIAACWADVTEGHARLERTLQS